MPPTSADDSPTIMAVRAPKMMRDSRSRPNWSVPSGCAQLGASIIAPKSFAVGLYGAISSAESPVAAITSTSTRPNVPSSSRRQNFSAAARPAMRALPPRRPRRLEKALSCRRWSP